MSLNEKQFITGFNSGYLLAKYEPQMLTILLKDAQPVNYYLQGMSSGQKEYELRRIKKHMDELEQIRERNKDSRDRGMD